MYTVHVVDLHHIMQGVVYGGCAHPLGHIMCVSVPHSEKDPTDSLGLGVSPCSLFGSGDWAAVLCRVRSSDIWPGRIRDKVS